MKVENPEAIVFVQCGYFYETYDEDAYTCSKLFGWKIADKGVDCEFTGVPINAFKFKEKLEEEGQSYIIVAQSEYPSSEEFIRREVNEVYLV